jgi:dihydroorotate dehydrogenase (fumarate)
MLMEVTMADLSVEYMGLRLKNPLIVGSSTLSDSVEKIIALEESGAGAVVLKSLYEEELKQHRNDYGCNFHPEAYNYDLIDADMIYGVSAYIDLIREAKAAVSIPVIASLNCKEGKWWCDYPRKVEDAGADALELNISYLSFNAETSPEEISKLCVDAVHCVKKKVSLPVSVKFSPYCCSIPNLAKNLKEAGAQSAVMFSRFFKLGIDLETMQCIPVDYYSTPVETYKVLRWVGVVSPQVDIDICSSTGIHSHNEAVQHILAGARCFQMVSAIFKKGKDVIGETLKGIEDYMDIKEFRTIDEMSGYMCRLKRESSFKELHYNNITSGKYPVPEPAQ